MKNIFLIAGFLFASAVSVQAQKKDTINKFEPVEKTEINEAGQLRKKMEQNQLNAPFEKLQSGAKEPAKKQKAHCKKGCCKAKQKPKN